MGETSTRSCAFNDCIQLALPCAFRHAVHLENHSVYYLSLAIGSNTARNTRFRWPDDCGTEHYRAGSWELSAFGQTRLDILLLAPASYLSVVAPFIMRDEMLPRRHLAGQVVALSGAVLLLLPALWFSFSDSNLTPTVVLIGESLVLLLLGIATRIRTFILSSAALLIVGTLRALFLSTPPSLALMLLGVMLVVIATALFLVRHKLKIAWTQWE